MILWRQIQKQNFKRWDALADFLELSPAQRMAVLKNPEFPLNLPLRLAQKIPKQTLEDPILRQFLPTVDETATVPGFTADPVLDRSFSRSSKLLHKYEGRALLVCTSACAMHCRYCFRQNFDYDTTKRSFSKELQAISDDLSLQEIILSGGDPLSLSDRILEDLLQSLAAIPHVKRIRFHTRFPIGIPERIDDSFVAVLSKIPKQIWFVIHANHPRELDEEVLQHLKQLQQKGIMVLNQAVLLRGVNDTVAVLKELCECLVNNGILPYYLHQLDRVRGASHFEVSEEEGHALIAALSKQISGYAVPKYVREIPGEAGKTMLNKCF